MYMFFGDSHSRQFIGVTWGILGHFIFSRASMKGLINTNSALRHGQVIAYAVAQPRDKLAFLMFGGVDLDFSFPRDVALKGQTDFDAFTEARIIALRAWLDQIFADPQTARHLRRVHLFAPQISPLFDDQFYPCTADQSGTDLTLLRKTGEMFDFTHLARAQRVHRFNDLLQQGFKDDMRVLVHRIDRQMVDDTGAIHPRFRPASVGDHHAAWTTQDVWRPIIEKAIKELPPPWDTEF